jgi:hypothetical protein
MNCSTGHPSTRQGARRDGGSLDELFSYPQQLNPKGKQKTDALAHMEKHKQQEAKKREIIFIHPKSLQLQKAA